MKNINLFKFKGTSEFWVFLNAHNYKFEDVQGFTLAGQKQCRGNILKTYNVHFKDGKFECFKVVIFEDFNEYKQTLLGLSGNKLINWFEGSEFSEIKE